MAVIMVLGGNGTVTLLSNFLSLLGGQSPLLSLEAFVLSTLGSVRTVSLRGHYAVLNSGFPFSPHKLPYLV
jgi:hypothetical protein